MPIYEYQCAACGHTLEALQKVSDNPLVECPSCRESSLKKLVSAASFRLKGSGWYETDFKRDKRKHLADSGDQTTTGDAGSGTDKPGDSKSGTAEKAGTGEKPAAKTESAKTDASSSGTTKSEKAGSGSGTVSRGAGSVEKSGKS